MEDTTKMMKSVLQSTQEMNLVDTQVGDQSPPGHRVISEPIGSIEDNMAQNRINARPNLDPKRLKRVLSNRESARRSRIKKQERITELERKVNELKVEVDSLTAQSNLYNTQWMIVKMENRVMKETICRQINEIAIKDAQMEQLKQERQRLMNLQLQPVSPKGNTTDWISGYGNNQPQIFNQNSSNFFM